MGRTERSPEAGEGMLLMALAHFQAHSELYLPTQTAEIHQVQSAQGGRAVCPGLLTHGPYGASAACSLFQDLHAETVYCHSGSAAKAEAT